MAGTCNPSYSALAKGLEFDHVVIPDASSSAYPPDDDIALSIAAVVIFALIIPPIRYARWRYEISDDFLEIMTGIIWKKRTVIPFIRVQNTDTKQGPLMRMFGLSSVTVSTAAGEHEIPGLDVQVADDLRNRAAELARVAREDV